MVENGEELIRRASPRQRAELSRVMAEAWFRLGEYSKPLDYLDAFVQAGGEMGRDENYLYGFSLYRTARYDDAAEYLRKACGADDALTQNASYHLADCYLRGGDKQQAMQSFAMASNAEFVQWILKVKSNIDSGMFRAMQLAAATALEAEQDWYDGNNANYRNIKPECSLLPDLSSEVTGNGISASPSAVRTINWQKH